MRVTVARCPARMRSNGVARSPMAFENYEDIRAGDVIECFRVEQVTRSL